MMQDKVKELVDKALEERPSLFLIDLNISPANQIIVVLDGDNGVSMQDCVEVSRAVESELDRDTYDYSIEVTTAGATSPITMPRQYTRSEERRVGREWK